MKRFISYLLVCAATLAAAGCLDDHLADDAAIRKGKVRVEATLDFKPMSTGLARTRTAGDAIGEINSLHVLLYKASDKSLVQSWEIDSKDYKAEDVDRTDADAENGASAESSTKRITFKLNGTVDAGSYYAYAVANIPDLLEAKEYAEHIKTVDGLKSLPLTWNPDDIGANGQMIGCFTGRNSAQREDTPLTLQGSVTRLHAWLRRAASKVTVAFDGSDLNEGVFIYLQSVQIKDIPKQCYLGRENRVGAQGYTLEYPENGPDMDDGEIFYYHKVDNPDDYTYGSECADHRITSGHPRVGSHGEKDNAFFFFENMQGKDVYDKRPDANEDGALDYPGLPGDPEKYPLYRLKDDVPYGTYIEVKAHYISTNPQRIGSGPIIYRFMLGQDEKKDFEAKRNCHYKLTLKFRRFANEADWHIEYEEPEPGVMTPEPYYISYLYNHSMEYPIKVNTGGRKIEWIKATILDNRWAPDKANPEIYWDEMDKPYENQWNGFLSLHKTVKTILVNTDGDNKAQYEAAPKRGEREYRNFEPGKEHTTAGAKSDDTYRVEKDPTEEHTYNIYIPMYTRAKQMIASTGYTGNNPYVAYQRKAEVQIETKLEGLASYKNVVPVYQVRRVVNPKGIYRSARNNKSFQVLLKRLPRENATHFETFQSEGPWKAYIVKSYNGTGISLSASGESRLVENEDPEYGDVIHGKTGSLIDFNVDFTAGNPGANRYAVVRVEYHNYTCQHLIFVRQGNEPDNLLDNGALWYAENMRTKTERASSPLDEGSLFRFGNWAQPLDALSNKNSKEPWINVVPSDFKMYPTDGFIMAGTGEKKTWSQITSKRLDTGAFEDPSSDMRVAELADYQALFDSDDIEQGYGVLYGDDATQTADDIADVYGYDHAHAAQGRGMRGCFVYNKTTGKNLFFPIGASGYGHRRVKEKGVLRYAAGRTDYYPSPGVNDRPLFYDLYRRPGAIYWLRNSAKGKDNLLKGGWDINYFTFDFNSIDASNMADGSQGSLEKTNVSSACFVRCVKK